MKIKYTKEVIELNEEQLWEKHQTKKANKQYGSLKEQDKSQEEYELLLDNQVDFIMLDVMSELKSKKQRIQQQIANPNQKTKI